MADADGENQFSGDEMFDDVGEYDLININRVDRKILLKRIMA